MKKIILVAAVLIGALIVVVPSFPQAQTTHTKTLDRTFDVYYGMPCANGGLGEDVHFSGTMHGLFSVTVNKNKAHWTLSFNPSGLTGVGVDTGTVYHATGVTRYDGEETVDPDIMYPSVYTFVNRVRFISDGPGENLIETDTVHITVNANGVITANFDESQFTCK